MDYDTDLLMLVFYLICSPGQVCHITSVSDFFSMEICERAIESGLINLCSDTTGNRWAAITNKGRFISAKWNAELTKKLLNA